MTKNSIIRKTLAIVTTVTLWASIAGPALAVTAEELQAQIDLLMAQLATLQTQLSELEGGTTAITGCDITSFDQNLKQGMSGDDVKCLQLVLNSDTDTKLADSGVGSPGNETSYFGPLTKAAVIKFQEKYADEVLASWNLTSGTGFVGSTTRAKLDSLLGAIPAGCECTAWADDVCGGGICTATQMRQTRTCTPAACTSESQCVTDATCAAAPTTDTISLADDTPITAQTALNAQDVMFTKVKFTAGADAYTISKIVITRGGVSADTDLSDIKLYDGTTQLGSTQALNTTTHKATFSGFSWEIPANSTKYLTIKGSIAASGIATVGDAIKLGIYVAADITSTVTPEGTYPIWGNPMTIAGISVGSLNVNVLVTPATTTILSGAVDQEIACWRFTASSTSGATGVGEGFNVHLIKVTHIGTATKDDLSNLKLKVAGIQLGSTVAELDASNAADFDLSASLLSINSGTSKTVCAYSDVASGIWTQRTIMFEITQYTDVLAYGSNTGGAVTITTGDDWGFYRRQVGNSMDIGQGTLAIAIDAAYNPSGQTYVKGTENRLFTALKFSTASIEGARVTKIRFTLSSAGTCATTDISNITLWDGTTQIAGPASVIGSYVTFGANTIGWDTTGLFDLEVSKVKTILVKADVPTGAIATHKCKLSIAAGTDVWADGLSSQYDLPYGQISGSATGNDHTVSAKGNLAVSLSATTPAAQTYVKGSLAKEFTRINLTADSGEDIAVSSILLRCFRSTGTVTCEQGDVSNVKLQKSDDSYYGSAVASPVATAGFSGSLTVQAAETESLKVIADIPASSNATSVHFEIVSGSVADDLTSTGVSSAADIVETGQTVGKLMTLGQGSLTISAAPTPADQTKIIGATEVPFVGLVMAAGTDENIRVTMVKLTTCTTDEGTTTDASRIALYDGTTRLTTNKNLNFVSTGNHTVTFSASDFLNSQGIDITKGQQKTITVKADLPSTASSTNTLAFGIASSTDSTADATATTSDVTFVGLSSNTTPAVSISYTAGEGGVNYTIGGSAATYEVTLADRGVLTVDTTADTPIKAIQAVGAEGVGASNVAFLKAYFKASLEEINVKSISIESLGYTTSTNPNDFVSVTLWDGATQLGSAQTLGNNASTTFNFITDDYWKIPTVGAKYLTIKANLNGIRTSTGYGAVTGDAPYICIDSITAEGVNSGLTPTDAAGTAIGTLDTCSDNYQVLRQSKPTISLASPTSETYGAGTRELIRWTVTADDAAAISWKKVVFDMSGSVIITSGGASYTVGSSPAEVKEDGVYMSTTTVWGGDAPANVLQLIATSSMQVWDVNTVTKIDGSSVVDQGTATGTARIAFVAYDDVIVAAGTTKTYKLIGDIQQGSGQIGSSVMTKIKARSTATTTDAYTAAAAATATSLDTPTFVWSDRSGGSYATHSDDTADWTNDFKISGIPTATKTLSK